MNSARVKQIIKEELNRVLKEDNPDVSTGGMTDDERAQAKYDAKQQYSNNAIKNIMITWLQQLTPVKYRQLYEDLAKLAEKEGVNMNKKGTTIPNIWAETKTLIDKWSKEGNKFNDMQLMISIYYSLQNERIAGPFARSGLVYKGVQG